MNQPAVGIPCSGFVQRTATFICPAAQRQWVDAMFAELVAIDPPRRRIVWMAGATAIVFAAIEARALTALSLRMRLGIAVAFVTAVASAFLSYVDVQAVLLDDEMLAVLSGVAAVALLGLAANAAHTVFNGPEPASDQGR